MTGVTEAGPGDYVKVGGQWKRIASNTAHAAPLPRRWTVTTTDGEEYGMYDIDRYATSDELEERAREIKADYRHRNEPDIYDENGEEIAGEEEG